LNTIEQNAETLSSFGLTVKQAKVYLALVSLGTAAVGEVSRLSKVRREEVYRILPKLERMGLIEKTLSTPVKLKAAPVENALSILIRNEEDNANNRILELKSKKEEFLDHFRTSAKEPKLGNGDQFALTSEKAVSLSKGNSLIDDAKSTLEIVISREKIFQFLKYFSDSLKQAAERGVTFRFIVNPSNGSDELPKAFNNVFEPQKPVLVRYLEPLPNHFLVVDNRQVLVATTTAGYLADNPLLWSNNVPHVMVYKKLFDSLWDSSVESIALNVTSDLDRLKIFLKQIKPSEHCILLYETGEAKLRVLLNHLKYGLDNGAVAVYICSELSVEEVKAAMQQYGLNVSKLEASGALKVLDYTQHYIIDGHFDLENTAKLWKSYNKEAISKGFKGLRVASETSCFFKHNLLEELVEYENSLHKAASYEASVIYAYRADQLMNPCNPADVYPKIVKAHGTVRFTWIDRELGRIAIS
jgi:sugar-specific transcriptional regulator TrmB